MVARIIAGDPDVAVLVDENAVLHLGPVVAFARAAPRAQQIPVGIELEDGRRRRAAFSRGRATKVAGRCTIQMRSSLSTARPATWPRIQFFGSGFGQNGSTWNFGISAAHACPGRKAPTAAVMMTYDNTLRTTPGSSPCFDREVVAVTSELRAP